MCHRFRLLLILVGTFFVSLLAMTASAAEPIRIGVIAPASVINGRAIFQAAELAVDEINDNGGVNGRQIKIHKYDNKASATNSVRAFQRAVQQDHVIAVVGNYISEAAIATEPWAARLKMPYIVTGAAATKITERVHDDYDKYKYVFRTAPNSAGYAKIVCGQSHGMLVKQLGYKTAVFIREDYAWTKPFQKEAKECLPKAGLKIIDTINVAPDTQDFSPIYSRIKKADPDVIIGVFAHMGVTPTVQWHQNQVPYLLAGWSSQAGSGSFWTDTNGAAQGEITGNLGAPGAAVTEKSVPFNKAYTKRFGESPAYAAYTTYDGMYILKNALERAGSTDADQLVSALEKTDYTGTLGHEVFQGKDDQYTHDLKVGAEYIPGVMVQWQDGKQVVIWPEQAATGKIIFPDFVPEPQ